MSIRERRSWEEQAGGRGKEEGLRVLLEAFHVQNAFAGPLCEVEE